MLIYYLTNSPKKKNNTFKFKDFLNLLFENKFSNIGKLSFHLAENKHLNNEKYPFVFMATITNEFDEANNGKHIPIATALKRYASEKNYIISLLEPLNKIASQNEFFKQLIESKEIFKPLYLTADKAYNFFATIDLLEKHNITLKLPNIWKNSPPKRLKVEVNFSLDTENKKNNTVGFNSMLNFSFKSCLNKLKLTKDELNQLLEQSKHCSLIQFKGEWVIAEHEKINKLLSSWQKLTKLTNNGLPFFTGLRLIAKSSTKLLNQKTTSTELTQAIVNCETILKQNAKNVEFSFDEKLKDFLNNFNNSKITMPELSPQIGQLIRPYQYNGVEWLWKMSQMGLGCCLADDMGLGKTLQVLSFLELQKLNNQIICSLLIVPASLLRNWKNEGQKFTPNLKIGILHSLELNANELTELKNTPENFIKKQNFDIVVTTYQMLQRLNKLQELYWQNIIIDEAQAIKNPTSQQSLTIRNLKGNFKIALTGTPIENSLFDLWSIFDFINPTLLGSLNNFKDFVKNIEEQNSKIDDNNIIDYSPIRKMTTPFILRRLKTNKQIINDLPDKSEINVYCNLEKKQLQLYQRAVRSLSIELKEYAKNADEENEQNNQRNGLIFKYLMAFKQICNHPAHFTGSGNYACEESGKFNKLSSIAQQLADRQEKVLVFTQFKEMIEPIYDLLASIFNTKGLILHGGTSVKKRGELVDKFQNDDDFPFFVLSLKAAGTGLNLTAANHVIHFDRWWNPAVENQATDRAYRIGQHRNVLVHKFVTMNTIEERIAKLIEQKATLANNLFSGTAEKLLTEMNDQELLEFITLDNEY